VASFSFTIAFVLCGLWHGLTINFLLWGAIHALALVIANLWRAYLKKQLGTQGVKRYLADRRVKFLAQVVTYEYVAFSLVVLFIP
jgi:membrane protein involved in D-alanine export